MGWGLVADSEPCSPDLILIDNLDADYLLFEKTRELTRANALAIVLVPVTASGQDPAKPGLVPLGIAEVMIRVAHLGATELLPIREIEPITLNVAIQVGEFLKSKPNIRSVLVVTDGFRSRRTQMIYAHALGKLGLEIHTCPVWGVKRPENWTATWHGIQTVMLQYVKFFYYTILISCSDLTAQRE